MTRFVIVFALVLAACSQHDDLPPTLPIIEAASPSDFQVTTSDSILFDLSWTHNDVSVVKFYRLYSIDIFTGFPAFIDTTAAMSAQINLIIPIPGMVFGVSAVSTGNIESRIVFGAAP